MCTHTPLVPYELLFILMSCDQSGNCFQSPLRVLSVVTEQGGGRRGQLLQAALQTTGEDEERMACQQDLLLKRLVARNQRQVQSERSRVWKNNQEQRERCFVFSPDRLQQEFSASQHLKKKKK